MEDKRDIRQLVNRAASGERPDRLEAFGELVRRFQDMAYGYAYSTLGDFHLAEDAAQEAFITAYCRLGELREPEAFAGWLRRLVHTACNRMTRRKQIPTAPLGVAGEVASGEQPSATVERIEMRQEVLNAIRRLPERQREATTLFYINGYTQSDIADFLEVPVSTVNSRLAAARKRLKERMLTMVADELKSSPLSDDFRSKALAEAFAASDLDGILTAMLPDKKKLLKTPRSKRPEGSEELFEALSAGDSWVEIMPKLGLENLTTLVGLVPKKKQLAAQMLALIEKHPQIAKATSRTFGSTLLHTAIVPIGGEAGKLLESALEKLIENGADVNARIGDEHGATPLHNAAAGGYLPAMRILLDHGAEIGARSRKGDTPLIVAAFFGQVEAIKLLLDRGASIDTASDNKFTALHTAVWRGNKEAARLLLERGANTGLGNDRGHTSLHMAAGYGEAEITELLLAHGADTKIATEAGNTALHTAAGYDQPETIQILLDHQADLESKSATGHTPLHVAACKGDLAAAKCLVANGGNIQAKSNNGNTPEDSAREAGHKKVARFLHKQSQAAR